MERDFESARGYGDLKKTVAEVVIEELAPVRELYGRLMDDVAELNCTEGGSSSSTMINQWVLAMPASALDKLLSIILIFNTSSNSSMLSSYISMGKVILLPPAGTVMVLLTDV